MGRTSYLTSLSNNGILFIQLILISSRASFHMMNILTEVLDTKVASPICVYLVEFQKHNHLPSLISYHIPVR